MAVMREAELQQQIRLAVGVQPDVVLWRNSVGTATTTDGRTQRFGLCRGAADLVGIGPGGRFFALEVKTSSGRLSPEQDRFLALVRSRGGFAAVVRSVDDALAAVERARGGGVE